MSVEEDRGDLIEGDDIQQDEELKAPDLDQEPDKEEEESRKEDPMIPKARFDAALAKERKAREELEARIARFEREAPKAEDHAVDIEKVQAYLNDLEDKYEDLLLDGNKVEARQVRAELTRVRNGLTNYMADQTTHNARSSVVEGLKYEETLAALEEKYPSINPDSDQYDEAVTNEIAELAKSLAGSGRSRVEALQKAVSYVIKAPSMETRTDDKNAEARRRNANANRQQPPSASGSASFDAAKEVARLSQDEFAKLDEKALAIARGDLIE